tara:strand:- start:2304 stop:2807 length:504 start_codon:yes stop_codon:yes gene_type:complete
MAIQKNFVVKNGLEVNTNLIFADTNLGGVGIATDILQNTLQVNGGIGATSFVITGISTLNNIVINGTVSVGSSIGSNKQYLVSTGAGVTWKSGVSPRTSTVYSAGIGSTSFSASYNVGLIDVYINGVRLIPPPSSYAEFTASDGSNIYLNDPCFGSELVELVVYNSL